MQVCLSFTRRDQAEGADSSCHATNQGVETSINVDMLGKTSHFGEDKWQLRAELQVDQVVVDSSIVPFFVQAERVAANAATNTKASFFRASCDVASSGNVRPSSERMIAFLNGELMFRSSGTSNLGRNYPGFWFPLAGVCPQWFSLQGGLSFEDAFVLAAENSSVLASMVLGHPMMFDKRFAPVYRERESTQTSEWTRLSQELQQKLANGSIPVDERFTAKCQADVNSGNHMFNRFTSFRQAVVSLQLGAAAWRASGYSALVEHIVNLAAHQLGKASVWETVQVPDQGLVAAKRGLCAVNEHAHQQLGFEIAGWQRMQQLFHSLPVHVRTELTYRTS
jgi:hypothetical protein